MEDNGVILFTHASNMLAWDRASWVSKTKLPVFCVNIETSLVSLFLRVSQHISFSRRLAFTLAFCRHFFISLSMTEWKTFPCTRGRSLPVTAVTVDWLTTWFFPPARLKDSLRDILMWSNLAGLSSSIESEKLALIVGTVFSLNRWWFLTWWQDNNVVRKTTQIVFMYLILLADYRLHIYHLIDCGKGSADFTTFINKYNRVEVQ